MRLKVPNVFAVVVCPQQFFGLNVISLHDFHKLAYVVEMKANNNRSKNQHRSVT